ncbi:MAG: lytic transglycosylase domain-containing protein [Xanthomonadales bacterium]|nr:lytic transglycosylase domain-containing protein [Xanthomonadales bacterium]
MISDEILDIARIEAKDKRITLALILGIVQAESSGDTWAYKPEPPYRYLWDVKRGRPFRDLTMAERTSENAPHDFLAPVPSVDPDAEWWGQQASWGLMQVMGAVAREVGFGGPYLTALCDPALGLHIGCTKLRRLLQAYGDAEMAVSAYNFGHVAFKPGTKEFENQRYVDKVITAAKSWQNRGVA